MLLLYCAIVQIEIIFEDGEYNIANIMNDLAPIL